MDTIQYSGWVDFITPIQKATDICLNCDHIRSIRYLVSICTSKERHDQKTAPVQPLVTAVAALSLAIPICRMASSVWAMLLSAPSVLSK